MHESTKFPKLISIAFFYNYKLPNPSGRDGFMISGPDAASETVIAVYDLQGRVVMEVIASGKTEMKIQHQLSKGSYLLKVNGGRVVYSGVVKVI